MNRTLRRPMFRMGGSAEGLTSGLAPRQKYGFGEAVKKLTEQRDLVEHLAPRKDTGMRDFLINFGLDLASRPPSGSIFSTAAASAKGPFQQYQAKKFQEEQSDRDLISQLVKGMNDDELSALMKDVKAGVDSGLFPDEATGIKLLLQKKIYGVLDAPGEADLKRIDFLEDWVVKEDPKTIGYARKVAEHLHKKQTGGYPEEITNELVEYPSYIKPRHWSKAVKPKVNEEGEIISFVIDGNFATTYKKGMYFEPRTGNIFKLVSKQGEAPVFVRVEFDQ